MPGIILFLEAVLFYCLHNSILCIGFYVLPFYVKKSESEPSAWHIKSSYIYRAMQTSVRRPLYSSSDCPSQMSISHGRSYPYDFSGVALVYLVYISLPPFTSVYLSLPGLHQFTWFTSVYLVYICLPKFNWFTSVYLGLPAFTLVHLSLTGIYLGLPAFTLVYLSLPAFTSVYLHLPWFTSVYLHLPWFTSVYLHLPQFTCIYLVYLQYTLFTSVCISLLRLLALTCRSYTIIYRHNTSLITVYLFYLSRYM